ncbi:MAG: hypothetical protein NC411_00215 [Bacteroides sp.]|nr:hypothetical protein [Bacteroides sp.]
MEAMTKRQTIADRFRALKVGESASFPFTEYNPSTIRSTPRSSLLIEMHEGYRWRCNTDVENGCMVVTRIS